MSGGRLRTLAIAVAVAAGLLVATRQLGPGGWHAPHGIYRAQVDALLAGRLALTPHPDGLAHDLAWTDGGAQQVWGLGAPAWQVPFELLGRAIGVTPFPDRVALLAWLALALYALARGFARTGREPRWIGAGAVLIAGLLPGVVALARGKLGVYEEAALYAYGAAMLMLGGLACFARRPTAAGYVLLVGLAGLGGLIRPTVWFYGAATLAVATAVWVRHARAHGGGWARAAALGAALFVAGGGLLYATNAHRFGRGGEFGHRLNLHSLPGNLYATRFGYPFERVGAAPAAAELVGALFDRPERERRAARGFYQRDLHVGQQPVPRWREYYFTTFSWPYVPVLAAGLALAVLAWRRRGAPDPAARWLGPWALLGLLPLAVFYLGAPSLSSRYQLDLAPGLAALLVIAWRALARTARPAVALGLLAVTWTAAVATSKARRPRRGGDPVDGAAAAVAAYRLSRPLPSPHPLPGGYDADDPAFGAHSDIATSFERCTGEDGAPVPCDAPPLPGDRRVRGERDARGWLVVTSAIPRGPEMGAAGGAGGASGASGASGEVCEAGAAAEAAEADAADAADAAPRCEPPLSIATAPDAVVERVDASPVPLYLDAFGWDLDTRRATVATYVFVDDPRFVEVEVSYAPEDPAAAPRAIDWAREVRAAIDLVHLAPVAFAETARGVRVRFEPPRPLRPGLRVLFLAFGPDTELDRPRSDFLLHALRWR